MVTSYAGAFHIISSYFQIGANWSSISNVFNLGKHKSDLESNVVKPEQFHAYSRNPGWGKSQRMGRALF